MQRPVNDGFFAEYGIDAAPNISPEPAIWTGTLTRKRLTATEPLWRFRLSIAYYAQPAIMNLDRQ
jgi:hypothetical protein